jgi:hypothetical protein
MPQVFSYIVDWDDPKTKSHICPQCGQTLSNMGRKFKPPRQKDVKQWRKVELIHRAGKRNFPKYLWQAKNQLENVTPKSEGERLLRRFTPKKD